jgi:hypothetical protein
MFNGSRFDGDVNLDEAGFPENFPPDSFAAIGWANRKSSLFGAGYFFRLAGAAYWKQEPSKCSEPSG